MNELKIHKSIVKFLLPGGYIHSVTLCVDYIFGFISEDWRYVSCDECISKGLPL